MNGDFWTEEQDKELIHRKMVHRQGNAEISRIMRPYRTPSAIKNRYTVLRTRTADYKKREYNGRKEPGDMTEREIADDRAEQVKARIRSMRMEDALIAAGVPRRVVTTPCTKHPRWIRGI